MRDADADHRGDARVVPDVVRQRDRIAGPGQRVHVEGLGHQVDVATIEQVPRLGEHGRRGRSSEELRLAPSDPSDVQPGELGAHGVARVVEHVLPVREERRETVLVLARVRIDDRGGGGLTRLEGRDLEHVLSAAPVDDLSVLVPGAAAVGDDVLQDLGRTGRDVDPHQPALREEPDRFRIGRPERVSRAKCPLEPAGLSAPQVAQPQVHLARGILRAEHDRPSVR